MASGDIITNRKYFRHIKLLDAIGAANDGVWIDCISFTSISIEVSGITTATVLINSSNAATKPANTAHGQLRGTFTADGDHVSSNLPRWIKARISAWTSGTISAIATLRGVKG